MALATVSVALKLPNSHWSLCRPKSAYVPEFRFDEGTLGLVGVSGKRGEVGAAARILETDELETL